MFFYRRKNFVVFMGGLLCGIVLLNIYGPMLYDVHVTVFQRLLASTILFIAMYPTYSFLSGQYQGVPFLALWGWIFSIVYGIRVFIFGTYLGHFGYFPDILIEKTLLFSLIGLISCYVGYYFLPKFIPQELYLSKLHLHWDVPKARIIAFAFGFVGLVFYASTVLRIVPARLHQLLAFMADFPIFAVVMLFMLKLNGKLGALGTFYLWFGLVIPRVLLGVSRGTSHQVMIVFFMMMLCYVTFRPRIPLRYLVILLILFYVFQAFKATFYRTGDVKERNYTITERLMSFPDALARVEVDADPELYKQKLDRITPGLFMLALIVDKVPNSIAYRYGETIYPLLFQPIPRLIWPDKPVPMDQNELGRLFSIISPTDYNTTIRPTILGDLYFNFGLPGIVIGMFLMGGIYAYINKVFGSDRNDFGKVMINILVCIFLLDVEGNIQGILGGVYWRVIMLVVFNLVFLRQHHKGSKKHVRQIQPKPIL